MKDVKWRKQWTVGLVLLAMAGTVWGAVTFFPGIGGAAAAVAAPPLGTFATPIVIDPTPVAAGGFGDTIVAVEVGRDFTGPYAAIIVNVSPANSGQPLIGGAGAVGPMSAAGATFYGMAGNPPAGFALAEFVYRPTNDPVNPGWAALPGAASQIENGMSAVTAVAAQLRAFKAAAAAGTTPLFLLMECNVGAPSAPGPSIEFFKFQLSY